MTMLINRQDKTKAIDLLKSLLLQFILPGIDHKGRDAIATHVDWMSRQTTDMNVNCKLETVPELQLTRITLEIAYNPIAPMNSTKQ